MVNDISVGGNLAVGVLVGDIDPGETLDIVFKATVNELLGNGVYVNTADITYSVTVDPSEPPVENTMTTNEAIVTVKAPTIEIEKNI